MMKRIGQANQLDRNEEMSRNMTDNKETGSDSAATPVVENSLVLTKTVKSSRNKNGGNKILHKSTNVRSKTKTKLELSDKKNKKNLLSRNKKFPKNFKNSKYGKSSKRNANLTEKQKAEKMMKDLEEIKDLERVILGNSIQDSETMEYDSDDSENESKIFQENEVEKKPAWTDDEDDITFDEIIKKTGRRCKPGSSGSKQYQQIMQQKYNEIMKKPKWAEKQSSNNDLLNSCGNILRKISILKKGEIEYKKIKDLNCESYSEGNIKAIQFHPTSMVGLVAGTSGNLSLFQVDGKQNAKLETLKFEKFPIHCASFGKSGEEIIVGSACYSFFYCHNLMVGETVKLNNSKFMNDFSMKKFCISPDDKIIAVCGKYGEIYLLSARTKELITRLRMNSCATDLTFNATGSIMYSHSEDGEVYVWDTNGRTCINKFIDDGCLKGTCITASPNGELIACGSSSGVVNIYETANIINGKSIMPKKVIYNLVTCATSVKFNSSSEILAIASNQTDMAVKLVHCESMSVFSNFPVLKHKMFKPTCLEFSTNSGYFAVGEDSGKAHLFRLKHYGNY